MDDIVSCKSSVKTLSFVGATPLENVALFIHCLDTYTYESAQLNTKQGGP